LVGGWIGQSPNSYAIGIPNPPNANFYSIFRSAGQRHLFEFPEGVIRPKPKETENVYGCGILMNPDDKLTIFFTLNGILMGSVLIFFKFFLLELLHIPNINWVMYVC
jgi:hypothetical protein